MCLRVCSACRKPNLLVCVGQFAMAKMERSVFFIFQNTINLSSFLGGLNVRAHASQPIHLFHKIDKIRATKSTERIAREEEDGGRGKANNRFALDQTFSMNLESKRKKEEMDGWVEQAGGVQEKGKG